MKDRILSRNVLSRLAVPVGPLFATGSAIVILRMLMEDLLEIPHQLNPGLSFYENLVDLSHVFLCWWLVILTISIALAFALAGAALAPAAPAALWTIGTPDGAAMEFAPGGRAELTFTVGQSVVSKDFAGSQAGSAEWDGKGPLHLNPELEEAFEPGAEDFSNEKAGVFTLKIFVVKANPCLQLQLFEKASL